ncbi:DUF3299 domain-containing protein [Hyphomonas sp.]|uniref:DUF3299 domain-containing protein n=1 Tax=Hyphomonas sp. TaxID=87 RepID=UPI003919C51A
MPSAAAAADLAEPEPYVSVAPPVQETGHAVPESAHERAAGLWGLKPGDPVPLNWEDLMPEGGLDALDEELAAYFQMLEERYSNGADGLAPVEHGSAEDVPVQIGSFETVPELDGMFVRIPGYAVPLEAGSGRRHRSFLLVPYAGACIHSPAPPPNQIVHIEAENGVQLGGLEVAYWAEGLLRAETQETSLAAAAYTLTLTRLEPFRTPAP